MRGVARGLIAALVLLAALPDPAVAGPFLASIRDLDGAQFLEDEPIWMCDDAPPRDPEDEVALLLLGVQDDGQRVRWGPGRTGSDIDRRSELTAWFHPAARPELHPLGPSRNGGLRAGRYEIRPAGRDSVRVLATFRVLEPRGSELAVRAALARAFRLKRGDWLRTGPVGVIFGKPTQQDLEAVRLYDAVLERYPRTSYRTVIYANLASLRTLGRLGPDGSGWIEEIFAHFNNTCFGEWAIHEYANGSRREEVRPQLRRLVGLYPDTRMSKAAARYL